MKISVIIPVYNVSNYVEKCVKSVLQQTYEDLEIILINDGSTDDSYDKIKSLSEKYTNLVIHSQQNKGLSATRNKGIELSTGEALFFLDSDDWIEPDTISKLVSAMIEEEVDISICGINQITGSKEVKKVVAQRTLMSGRDAVISYYYRKYDMEPMVWNKLYRKELFSKINFEVGILHEDKYFTPRILFYAENVCFIPYVGYNYVFEREGSITTSKLQRKNLQGLDSSLHNSVFFLKENEPKLSRLAKIKYYVDLSYYYCLYRFDEVEDISKELHEVTKSEYLKSILLSAREFDIKSMIRITYFRFFEEMYYNTWLKKRG